VQGSAGPAAEIGLYRLFGRRGHGGIELSVRYSRVRYSVGDGSVDGSGVGALLSLNLNP